LSNRKVVVMNENFDERMMKNKRNENWWCWRKFI